MLGEGAWMEKYRPKVESERPVHVRRQANPHRPGIHPGLGLRARCIPANRFPNSASPAPGSGSNPNERDHSLVRAFFALSFLALRSVSLAAVSTSKIAFLMISSRAAAARV